MTDGVAGIFHREQISGLTIALKGRLAVLVVIAIWIGVTRTVPSVYYMLGLIVAFAAIGGAQLYVVNRYGVRAWLLYFLMFAEIALLVTAIAVFTGPVTYDLPVPMGFRFSHFLYFFLFIASAAFSYSPALVLWSGLSVATCWAVATVWVVASFDTFGWSDLPVNPTRQEFLNHIMDPLFFGVGTRVQEIIVLLSVAVLLAIVVWRARRVVFRQAEAEKEREEIADTFGRYVPEAVAKQLISDHGVFAPQERDATVLITDIENFTGIIEKMAPADVLEMLNEYFEQVGNIITSEGGVIGQFHGDAVIATFNVPIPKSDHAAAAIRTGLALNNLLATRRFSGQALRTRIGINTGKVVSGSVGSQGRRSYTVYGDAVNVAQRIEAANKEFGTACLVSETTRQAAVNQFHFHETAELVLRGKSEALKLFRPEPREGTA